MDQDYTNALENVLTTALLLVTAHRMEDVDAVFDLLDRLAEAMDTFNEICDEQFPDDDEEEEDE